MFLDGRDMQFGHGETVGDTARVHLALCGCGDRCARSGIRVCLELGANGDGPGDQRPDGQDASVPVDGRHPDVRGTSRADWQARWSTWSGAGNNVCASWIHAAVRFKFELRVACPPELEPDPRLHGMGQREQGGKVHIVRDPHEAVSGTSSAVVTDTWVQMSESDNAWRGRDALAAQCRLSRYRVDEKLMAAAAKDAIFMHCLPAHRGEEVTDEVCWTGRSRSCIRRSGEPAAFAEGGACFGRCRDARGRTSSAASKSKA